MRKRDEAHMKNRFIVLLLIIGAVFFFLKYLSPLTAPLLMAVLFVTIFGPFLKKIQVKLHVHRQIGAIILLLLAGMFSILLVWILFSWIVSGFPEWIAKLDIWENNIRVAVQNMCIGVEKTLGIDSSYLEEILTENAMKGIEYLREDFFQGVLLHSFDYVKTVGKVGAFFITFLIGTVLLAKDYDEILNKMLNKEDYHLFLEIFCGIIKYIASYVKAQLIIMSAIACLCAVSLKLIGVNEGILWGILAGVLDAFPFVGTGVVLIPLAIGRYLAGFYVQAIVCVILYVVCIFVREIWEPKLVGKKIGVSPIAVLLSLYAGVKLFGVMGIVKGPLGFIIILQIYQSIMKRESGN